MARPGPRRTAAGWMLAAGFLISLCAGFALGLPWGRQTLAIPAPPSIDVRMEAGRRFAKLGDHWFAVREEAKPISLATARALAAELTENEAGTFRLPTDTEWEHAARGGIPSAPYPWGNQKPTGERMAQANGYGLIGMAGGLAEWCDDGTLRGGSWAEKADVMFRIDQIHTPKEGYFGEDAGLRLVWEPPGSGR